MLPLPKHIERDVSLAAHTYFRIGGPARYFAHVSNEETLVSSVAFAKENNLRIFVLSGGSNVLVSDNGFDGLVLHMEMRDITVLGNVLRAESGVPMAKLVATGTMQGLSGVSWAIGVPGMVGGSVRGNAGCFGGEVKDVLTHVRAYDISTQEWRSLSNKECDFAYRESMFKHHPELIIVSADFLLRSGDKGAIADEVRAFTQARVAKQDIGEKCAGCMFKNPEGAHAGELIDRAGLKGYAIGGARISKKHGNFIVNDGNASANDVQKVVAHIKEKIQQSFHIALEEEIQFIS